MPAATRSTDLFDRWSATYDSPTLQRLTYRPIHDAVLRRIDGSSPSTVLDLGCGTGQMTRRLRDRLPDATVIGLDLSTGMLAEATDRLTTHDGRTPSLVRADAMRLPLADGSIDLVVCTESFHWYPSQADALQELARVLGPRGQLLIASIATVTDVGHRLLRRATSARGQTIRALPPLRLRGLVTQAGFDVVCQRRVPRPGPLAWPVLTDARVPGRAA